MSCRSPVPRYRYLASKNTENPYLQPFVDDVGVASERRSRNRTPRSEIQSALFHKKPWTFTTSKPGLQDSTKTQQDRKLGRIFIDVGQGIQSLKFQTESRKRGWRAAAKFTNARRSLYDRSRFTDFNMFCPTFSQAPNHEDDQLLHSIPKLRRRKSTSHYQETPKNSAYHQQFWLQPCRWWQEGSVKGESDAPRWATRRGLSV